ncbi:MAG TPA: single-stranded DNA-binding protein, partial [Candidatus Onthosoma merdavium]|nr:single-stranded DNA-binding protein [Candidatus Onthosoma merdavium]
MLNSIILVGKIETLPEIKETSGGHKLATLGLLLDRPFK